MAPECRITVLASGNGSNLQALIDACAGGRIPASAIVRLVVNRKKAFAVQRAERAGIPATYFNLISDGFQAAGEKDPAKLKEARERYDAELALKVLKDEPDLVVLAGWMHVFTEGFLRPLDKAGIPVINIHPALAGQYDGANAIERAFNDFQAGKLQDGQTGIMVHYVIAEVDRGDPILIERVDCEEGESLADLENRMHAVEHELIVRATAQVAQELSKKKI